MHPSHIINWPDQPTNQFVCKYHTPSIICHGKYDDVNIEKTIFENKIKKEESAKKVKYK